MYPVPAVGAIVPGPRSTPGFVTTRAAVAIPTDPPICDHNRRIPLKAERDASYPVGSDPETPVRPVPAHNRASQIGQWSAPLTVRA
jgi:hypothetical protein